MSEVRDSTGDLISFPSHGERQRAPEPPNERPLIAALVCGILLSAECGTAFVAWRMHSVSWLGRPSIIVPLAWRARLTASSLLLIGAAISAVVARHAFRFGFAMLIAATVLLIASQGAVYSPLHLINWQLRATDAGTKRVLVQAWSTAAAIATLVSIAILILWRRHANASRITTAHGSAHWGRPEPALTSGAGVIVGRGDDDILRLPGEGHLLTVAPTRSGKGVSCVIPNLLDHPGSALITDPKGENYAVTANWRRLEGHRVHALDPFGLVNQLACYNPVDLVDVDSPDATDDARMLADMLVLSEGKESGDQSFWNEEARGLLTGLILHAASNERPAARTLTEMRDLLTQPPDRFQAVLKAMSKSKAADGLVARAAARLLQKADRERSGVVSTAQSHTHFLDSPRMKRVLGTSSFDFASLKRESTTVYLILPTDRIDGYARWLRLMIACGLLAITRARGQPRDRVLFLLDEFAHLRKMHPVQRDIGLAGGYGVRFWLILQDLSQLRSTYGDGWQTFLANVDLLQAFGTSDWDTAEYLSKMTGEATIQTGMENHSTGITRGRNAHQQRSASWSTSEAGRRLLFADEIRRLPRDRQLLFVKGMPPFLSRRVNYLTDAPFTGRAAGNPLYAPVAS